MTQNEDGSLLAVTLRDGTVAYIRAISAADAEREQAFVRGLSAESRYFRFMNSIRELDPAQLNRFIRPDPDHEIVLIALDTRDADARQIGVVRCTWPRLGEAAEFAVAVGDAYQGKGLGSALMAALAQRARERGIPRFTGLVLASNQKMLELMRALGFHIAADDDDARLRRVTKDLV